MPANLEWRVVRHIWTRLRGQFQLGDDLAAGLRNYELTVILSPEIGDDSIQGNIDGLQESITSRGGEVVELNHWGRRRLAYPIKKHLEGNYVLTQIRIDPAHITEIESGFRISEEVLRHLFVRADD